MTDETVDDLTDDPWGDGNSEDEGSEFENDDATDYFAVLVSQHISNEDGDALFQLLEQQESRIGDRLKELDTAEGGGAGSALDGWAEQYPEWFAQQVAKCSPTVRDALLNRTVIEGSVRGLLAPQPPGQSDTDLGPADLGPLPPPPPDDLPPLVDEEENQALTYLRAGDFGTFFQLLLGEPRLQSLLATDYVGAEIDVQAAANDSYFTDVMTWVGDQPGGETIVAAISARPQLANLVGAGIDIEPLRHAVADFEYEALFEFLTRNRQRVSQIMEQVQADRDLGEALDHFSSLNPGYFNEFVKRAPEEVKWALLGRYELRANLSSFRDQREPLTGYAAEIMESGADYDFLNRHRDHMDDVVAQLAVGDPEPGRRLDAFAVGEGEAFARWVENYRSLVESALRQRPAVAAVIDRFHLHDAAPDADTAGEVIGGFVDAADFEGLFNALLAAPRHAETVISQLDPGVGARLDGLVQQNAQVFVAWLDWCNEERVQLALLNRKAISDAVEAVRRPQFGNPAAGTSAPASDQDADAVAETVANARELLQRRDLDALFRLLYQSIARGTGSVVATNLGADWWDQFEGLARDDPPRFAEALTRRGNPAVEEFLQSRSPAIDLILRNARRAAVNISLSDQQKEAVDVENERFLKNDLANGAMSTWTAGGVLVLIGPWHDDAVQQYVNQQSDRASGNVQIRKGSTFRGAGALTFSDCPPAKQGMVTAAVQRFSSKKVVFAAVETASVRQRPGRRRR